jgi:hypothetical protein
MGDVDITPARAVRPADSLLEEEDGHVYLSGEHSPCLAWQGDNCLVL